MFPDQILGTPIDTKLLVIGLSNGRAVRMRQSVEIPVQLFKKLVQASEVSTICNNAFEDYLISINSLLLRKLRKARPEHLAGKTRPSVDLKHEFELAN